VYVASAIVKNIHKNEHHKHAFLCYLISGSTTLDRLTCSVPHTSVYNSMLYRWPEGLGSDFGNPPLLPHAAESSEIQY
jgi:hypothetical protein